MLISICPLSQAEAMVAEWKEFLWDIPQERAALWGHCQSLFMRYSLPPLQVPYLMIESVKCICDLLSL